MTEGSGSSLMALVQVGISIYGQNLYQVKSCIESCLAQDNCLITCRTDGPNACSEDVLSYIKSMASEKEELRLIIGDNQLGNFGSLNRIFAISETPYLCQLDADDMLAPGALEICVEHLEKISNASFLYTDCLEIDDRGVPVKIGERSLQPYTELNSLVQFIPFHLRLIRRSFFCQVGGYDSGLKYTGDYDISLKLAEVGDVLYLNRPLYFYRIHPLNSSFSNFQNVNSEVLFICNRALARRGLAEKYRLVQGEMGKMTIVDV